ncbi:MAG: hypothetical protein KKH93_04170 [Candidatus Omnitrophica bacterium]|nr:hypothetical protein [Candidatus Omnitrophota bacterium]MBU2044746.1 hypothetical protein [Candidatus Omnitrophota bacterium]MBU2250884.1 hypothetical protein [Candidatus Omnitrophota bacterium]MBU2473889.1 hypothetical protein [Candidatus Omnitrophota bacterium]
MDRIEELIKNYLVASESRKAKLKPVPKELIDKTKTRLGIPKTKSKVGSYALIAAAIAFVFSFIFPKYFMQCLVVTLIFGIRWALNSEGGRTLIMVLDSWRHHSQEKDEEISHRLKR